MQRESLVLALSVLLLAGCAKPMEVGSITRITPLNGATGVDVYENRRRQGDSVPEFAGDQLFEVRTFTELEGGARGEEFAGADCLVQTRDYEAKVKTPAKVRVPIYRAQTSPIAVSCKHDRHAPKLVEVAVINATKSGRLQAGSGGGLIGVVFMAAVNELSDESNDNFVYTKALVTMKPLAETASIN